MFKLLLLYSLISFVSAETHVYSGESIQDAIDGAPSGEIIIVHDGTYIENLVIEKDIILDSENGDYSLQENSPCIDAGTADLDGDGQNDIADYYGQAPDMGAYEFEETSIQGDLNGDGLINVQDVVALVNIILGAAPEVSSADYNGDGLINVLDVVEMVTFILRDND